jgi:hypothetical protein
MQKSTIPFLATSLFLVLVSCGSNKLTQGYNERMPEVAVFEVPYFANPETDYVYKANITIYGNELTGIFIAKKINADTHRVVFTTEFGNKLIDVEISETDFKVNSVVDELNRKIVLNTLRDDFRLLLRRQFAVQQQFENAENTIYQSADGKNSNYLFVSKTSKKLVKIVNASPRKEKINLSFTSEKDIFAEDITITHYNIKLKITFHYFKS